MEPAKRSHPPPALLDVVVVIMVGALSGPSMADQVLYPGSSLRAGQYLSVSSYILSMQADCNLVLYAGGIAKWATNTYGRGTNCRVTMQRNGNLVLFTGAGSRIWTSGTARATGNYALVLQRDRNLVIYGSAIWATGTNRRGRKASIPKDAVLPSSSSHGAGGVVVGGGVGGRNATSGAVAGGEGNKN